MALNGLFCADVPLRNYSLTFLLIFLIMTLCSANDVGNVIMTMVLYQVAKAASTSLNNCVNCLPGLREVDEIVKHVSNVSIKLTASAAQVGFCVAVECCLTLYAASLAGFDFYIIQCF